MEIKKVLVPTEEVVEIKEGKRVNVDKKYFPRYILVKTVMNDETWHLIKSVPRASNFLGTKDRTTPISKTEVKEILEQVKASVGAPRSDITHMVRVLGKTNFDDGEVCKR